MFHFDLMTFTDKIFLVQRNAVLLNFLISK